MSAKQAIRNAQSPTPAWYTHEQRFEFPISIQVGDRFLKADLIKRLGNELVDRELPYQPYKPKGCSSNKWGEQNTSRKSSC